MGRKITALLLSAIMLISTIATIDISSGTVSAEESGDFIYRLINNDSEVEITGYEGPDSAITIPDKIDGKPVTSIGSYAFYSTALTSVIIPDSVKTIGYNAFAYSTALTSITVGANNPNYSDIDGVLYDKHQTELKQIPGGKSGEVTIPDSVTSANLVFHGRTAPITIIFQGNAPWSSYSSSDKVVIYYYEGATGFTTPTWLGMLCNEWKTPIPGSPRYLSATSGNAQVSLSWSAPDYAGNSSIDHYVVYVDGKRYGEFPGTTAVVTGLTNGQNYVFKVAAHNSFGNGRNATAIALPTSVSNIYTCRLINGDTEVEITGYVGPGGAVNIPDKIDGKPVTSIGSEAFYSTVLTSVIIGSGVTSIGSYAFAYSALTIVIIPDSVTSISDSAFYGCSALTSITVGANNPNYSDIDGVLYNKTKDTLVLFPSGKGGEFTIPDSVETIGSNAFYNTVLTSVIIGSGVTSIGSYAFAYSALTSVIIPDSVKTIGYNAFAYSTALTSITVGANNPNYSDIDGVLYSKDLKTLIQFPGGRGGEFTIPDSVETIGSNAFYNTVLTSVIIPDSVETIGWSAFAYCFSLTTIIFNGNAPSTESWWADGSDKLTIYYYEGATDFDTPTWNGIPCYPLGSVPTAPNGLIAEPGNGNVTLSWSVPSHTGDSIIDHYVVYVDGKRYGEFTGTTAVVTGLVNGKSYEFDVSAHNSFGNVYNATIAAVPNMISGDLIYRLINDGTEVEITGYEGSGGEITIPDSIGGRSVTSIGSYAFYNSALTSVIIPDSVTSIGEHAFYNSALTSVTIGNSVETIGSYAFSRTALTSVTIPDSVISIGSSAFAYNSALTTIKVGDNNPKYSSLDGVLYDKHQTELIQFPAAKGGEFTIPDSVETIGYNAFAYSALTSVIIPDSVTSIGEHAFYNSALTSVTIGNGVETIGSYAFAYSALTTVVIPDSVTSIGDSAFYSTALISITVGDDNPVYSSLGDVLYDKHQTELIQIPGGKSGEVTIPDSVTFIDYGALSDASIEITFKGDAPSFNSWFVEIKKLEIFYYEGATGFTTPNWHGIPSYELETSIPGSPRDFVVVPGDAQATLSWSAPSYTGDLNIDYYVVYVDGKRYGKFTETSAIVTDLTSGKSYIFNVAAHNSAGNGRNATATATLPLISNGLICRLINNDSEVEITGYEGPGGAITIPDSIGGRPVTRIASSAFIHNANLTAVTLGNSVTYIGDYAFINSTALTSITVSANNPEYSSLGGVLYDKYQTRLIQYPAGKSGEFTIPNSVETIGEGAFAFSTALTSVTLGSGVTSIDSYAFAFSTALTSITVGANNPNYSDIGGVLYSKDLKTLIQFPGGRGGAFTIPNSVETIGEGAFVYNTALTSIIIPDSVTYIGYNAFYSTALTTIIFNGSAPSTESWWAGGSDKLTIFYHEGATGFDTPTWKGVPCYPLGSVPTAPNGLIAAPGNGSVTLSWSAPSYTGGSVIEYYYIYQDGVYVKQVPGTATSAVITGLTNGQSYEFNVSARNSGGHGYNATVAATPTDADLVAPTIIEKSPTGKDVSTVTKIVVTFSEAMDHDSVVITVNGDEVTISWNENVATFTPSSALKGNTEYEVTVNGKDLVGNALEATSWKFTTASDAPLPKDKDSGDGTLIIVGGIIAIIIAALLVAVLLIRRRSASAEGAEKKDQEDKGNKEQ